MEESYWILKVVDFEIAFRFLSSFCNLANHSMRTIDENYCNKLFKK